VLLVVKMDNAIHSMVLIGEEQIRHEVVCQLTFCPAATGQLKSM
jgi:hypothetical protein